MVSLDKQGMFPLWEPSRWRAGESHFCGLVSRISPREACVPWKFVSLPNDSVFSVVAIKANSKKKAPSTLGGGEERKKKSSFSFLDRLKAIRRRNDTMFQKRRVKNP